jgi:Concanavalin A-like lectin/glucanases superfamily
MKLNKLFKGNYQVLLSTAVFALLGIQAARADYPGTILADKPLGYYRLEETGGNTIAVDSSASGAFPGTYVQNYGSDGTTVYPIEGQPGIDTNSIALSAAAASDYVAVGNYPQFNQPGPFSFEIWARPTSVPTGGNYRCPIGNSPAYDDTILSGWYVYQTPDVPSELAMVSPSAGVFITTTDYTIDNWYYIAGTYDGTNMYFYLNGVLVGSQNASTYVPNSANSSFTGPFAIGQRGDGYGNFDGDLDEAAYYTNTLSPTQILAHYMAGTNSFRVAALPPAIVTAPTNETVYAGQSAQFILQVDGSAPFSYQWYDGTTPILNATNATYSFVTAPVNDGSSYTVVATNFVGSVTSTPVTLSVSTGIQIDAALTSITRNVGSAAAFEIVAEGAQPLTYQWLNGSTSIAGATNSVLWLTNVQASANGASYSVEISNPYTSQQSAAATLTVQARPVNVPVTGYAKVVESDGPVAYWRLDEPAGSTNAVDAVGSFDGAYVATNYVVSTGLTSDGTLTYDVPTGIPHETDGGIGVTNGAVVSIPYAIEINPPGAFSVEGWIKAGSLPLPSNPNDYRTPLSSMSNPAGAGPSGWLVYQTAANNWSWWPYNGFYGGVQLTDNSQIVANQWYYLTMVYDGSTFTFYVDGVAQASGPDNGFVQNGNVPPTGVNTYNYNYTYENGYAVVGSSPTILGWRSDGGFNPFSGSIDDVAVYNKALTPAQIQSHFLNTTHLTATESGKTIVISWSVGTLQSATVVTGPYTDVAGATSPYTNVISGAQMFFRAHVE